MRRTYVLSASNPAVVADLTFTPSTVLILNNTDKSVYMNVGRAVVPDATFFDLETLPAANGIPSNVALPNNSNLFALFLPTPTDATKTVTVTFQGTSDPFSNRIALPTRGSFPLPGGGDMGTGSLLMGGGKLRNYQQYRLNARNLRQQMELSWFSDQIFILNNSDGWLYFREGGVDPPTSTFYDIPIPPKSYTILNPRGGWQFAATLDNPTDGKDCFIIYAYGYADEYRSYKELIGEWDWYLPPLTVPTIQWFFDWQFAPQRWYWCFDLTQSNFGWLINPGTWVSGVGVRQQNVLGNTWSAIINGLAASFGVFANIDEVYAVISNGQNVANQTGYFRTFLVTGNINNFHQALAWADNQDSYTVGQIADGSPVQGIAFRYDKVAPAVSAGVVETIIVSGLGVVPAFAYGQPC